MITQQSQNYAIVLDSLQIAQEMIEDTKHILLDNSQVLNALDNPTIKKTEKEAVIDKLFPVEIRNFLKVLCQNKSISISQEIFEGYETLLLQKQGKIKATLAYATKLSKDEIVQIKEMICTKYNKTEVQLKLEEDSSLIGGFILTVGNTEYDKSIKGTLDELRKALVRR